METRIQKRYIQEDRIELNQFTWMRWRTGFFLTEKASRYSSKERPINDLFLELVDGGPATACENYDPFSEPELEIQFSEIKTADDALRFANRFGMLGLSEEPWRQAYPDLRNRIDEEISDWLTEARTVERVLNIWSLVQANDNYGLRKIIRRKDGQIKAWWEPGGWALIAGPGFNQKWLRSFRTDDFIGPASLYLATEVNRHLRKCASVGIGLVGKYRFEPYQTPVNLLSAIWIRVSEVLTGKRKLKLCAICNKFLDVTDSRSHKLVHKSCSVRERVRKWRKAHG